MADASPDSSEPHRPVAARLAAAVTLLRDGEGVAEVFLVRRHVRSEFVPDAFVFPGGSVQTSDAEAERMPDLCAPSADSDPIAGPGTGLRVAALRECFEEAGVLLARRGPALLAISPDERARFATYRQQLNGGALTLAEIAVREGLTLATDTLLRWAHWITPELFPKRFDTHFFLGTLPPGQQAAHDEIETTAGIWITPEAALARFEDGTLPLVFATIHQLRALTGLESAAAARARFAAAPVRTIRPRIVQIDGADTIVMPGDESEEG